MLFYFFQIQNSIQSIAFITFNTLSICNTQSVKNYSYTIRASETAAYPWNITNSDKLK